MPLPVIFKFLSDTTGLKFNEVNRGLDGINVSSQKAGAAVRNFASIVRSGQEPVAALADSFSYLARAFGLGVAGTVAVVGAVEVIKSFVSESQKLNTITEKLNTSLRGFRDNAGALDFSGAVKQVKALSGAIADAREQAAGESGGIMGRVGRTIFDLIGGAEYRLRFTQDLAKNELALARDSAKTALQKEIELESLKGINPLEVKRLEIQQKYFRLEQDLKSINADKETFLLLQFRLSQELVNLDEEAAKEKAKADEESKKAIEERIRLSEQEVQKQVEINEKRRKGLQEYNAGLMQIEDKRRANATPLIDRIVSAAENLGLRGFKPLVEKQRKETQKQLDKELLGRLGITSRDYSITGQLFPSAVEKIQPLLNLEAQRKAQEDKGLFDSVYGIRQAVQDLKAIIEQRLGVPILRTAY